MPNNLNPNDLLPPITEVLIRDGHSRPNNEFYGTLAMRDAFISEMETEDSVFWVIAFGTSPEDCEETCKLAIDVLHPDNEYGFEPIGKPFEASMLDREGITYLVFPPTPGRRPLVHEYESGVLLLDPIAEEDLPETEPELEIA